MLQWFFSFLQEVHLVGHCHLRLHLVSWRVLGYLVPWTVLEQTKCPSHKLSVRKNRLYLFLDINGNWCMFLQIEVLGNISFCLHGISCKNCMVYQWLPWSIYWLDDCEKLRGHVRQNEWLIDRWINRSVMIDQSIAQNRINSDDSIDCNGSIYCNGSIESYLIDCEGMIYCDWKKLLRWFDKLWWIESIKMIQSIAMDRIY